MLKYLFIFIVLLFITSCSPKINDKDIAPTDSINKPELDDMTTLVQPEAVSSRMKLQWQGEVSTSEINIAIKDFIELGHILNESKFKAIAIKLYNKLNKADSSWGEKFENSPYMDLFRYRALPEVKKEVKKIEKELNASLLTTKKIVTASRNKIKWPAKATFEESISFLEKILEDLDLTFPATELYPEFKTELISQFKIEKTNNINYLKSFNENLKSNTTLSFLIAEIKKLAVEYSYNFDKETKVQIDKATILGNKIDIINDDRTALAAIIEVWLFLDKADREKEIKPISESLFNFLNEKSDNDVKCLADSNCSGLWDSLIKNLFILPKINSFGVKNIQEKLNERSYAVASNILNEKFFAVISKINQRINSMLDKGVAKGKEKLLQINSNTGKYVDSKLLDWINTNVQPSSAILNTYQWPITKISKNSNNVLSFTPINRDNSISKEAIGTSLQLAKHLLVQTNLDESSLRKLLLEQINALFAMGGIPEEFPTNSIYKKGLIRNLQSPNANFNLTNAITDKDSFSLEDKIILAGPYSRLNQNPYYKLSARSTANFVLGLVEFVDYFKDWEQNNFDSLLGNVKPSEIFQSEATEQEEPIFAKSKLFGYVTGHLANILSNFNKSTTPIALINSNNEITWSNNLSLTNNSTFLYSIFVNVENNFKAETMNLEDMSLLIQVLARLIETVDGIEKTKFIEFTKPKAELDGKSIVQIIKENIQKVSKAFIPLGNTIATKMKKLKNETDSGLIFNQININNFQNYSVKYYLSDQLKAMDAMILVYEKTQIDSYLWAAMEIFNYLQKFYNPKTNYFHFNDEVPTVPNTLQLLKTMIKIKPYLQKNEQVIVEERIRFLRSALLSVK